MSEKHEPMPGGDAVVAGLRDHGVRTLSGRPGVQLIICSMHCTGAQSWLRSINARHEQGVAYMALGCPAHAASGSVIWWS